MVEFLEVSHNEKQDSCRVWFLIDRSVRLARGLNELRRLEWAHRPENQPGGTTEAGEGSEAAGASVPWRAIQRCLG